VATFRFEGCDLTVVNNHFSSKGGSGPLFGAIQPAVALQESPAVNGGLDARRAQATAVSEFVDALLARDPHANVVVLGDMNEFEFVSPLEILRRSLVLLAEEEAGPQPVTGSYTFIFEGNAQALDHILVSESLASRAELDIVHVNTEFADTPQRASDHDPVVARLQP
jgi:predicted extracellular nuclease